MDSEIAFLLIALANVCISCLMIGLIWIVQIVTYPIFSSVGCHKYDEFHSKHVSLITPLVAPLMLFELFVGVMLLVVSGSFWHYGYSVINLIFLAIIWASTFFFTNSVARKIKFEV